MIVTTSEFKMNGDLFSRVHRLLKEYSGCGDVSAGEFVDAKLQTTTLSDEEIEHFVSLVAHKKFLEAVKNNFVSSRRIRNYKDAKLVTIIYLVVFASEGSCFDDLFDVFKEIKCAFKQKLLKYFCEEENLITTALTGCKFFEDEYVLKNIINPVLNKVEVLKRVIEELDREKEKKHVKKPPTVPDQMQVLQRKKPTPAVPLNTPVEFRQFEARQIPRTLYMPDNVEFKLMGAFERNRLKAQQLLAEAKNLSKNYCKPKKDIVSEEKPPPQFKAKRAPPVKSNVEIKANAATVLREGNLRIKEQEKEIEDIENILKGGFTLEKFKELEETERKLEQQQFLEDVERKHLEGLLTFEEAILAKKKHVEANKERFKQFMEEREQFLEKMDKWKQNEQKKIKMLVKKSHDIEHNAKESEKKIKEEKRNQVNQFKNETKKMLQDAYAKQKEELAKRVKLIEEIKTLHQLKSIQQSKEFDPTDCPNLGLLCQMSIAELQERLADMKIKMQLQLEQKRKCIKKYKERQRQMIENVKNFVAQARMSKPKQSVVPIRPTKLAHNPDLDKLRKQLEYARRLRKNAAGLCN